MKAMLPAVAMCKIPERSRFFWIIRPEDVKNAVPFKTARRAFLVDYRYSDRMGEKFLFAVRIRADKVFHGRLPQFGRLIYARTFEFEMLSGLTSLEARIVGPYAL
jgi:hypothetical protein